MTTCKICDCTEAQNKCKQCKYNKECDYCWVEKVWKEGGDLLTPLMPAWVKQDMRAGKMMTITGKGDFCVIGLPKKADYVTIQDICVSADMRGQGITKQMLNELMTTYDRDILAKCVKGSSAEDFWSHLGVKINEEASKKRDVCTYFIENKHKRIKKVDLF